MVLHLWLPMYKALHPYTTLLLSLVTQEAKVSPHEALVSHGPCQRANKPLLLDVVDALIDLDYG